MIDMSLFATPIEPTRFVVRARLLVRGAVQGVGFRPYVYRLAKALDLAGFVQNDMRGVSIEVEGANEAVEEFVRRLPIESPSPAHVDTVIRASLPATGVFEFEIRESGTVGHPDANVMPDLAVCPVSFRVV